ncbi:fatty-acid amide hydrolase 2-like [Ostrinia furnacalis]|uniref:fatty-acid amide hydrolase 2-like n=1 Tax=Ostrinia furnacalis TaxID=93504 RepID=UPI00103D8166|nr:fatty-acid amide hydrolase 2-like [Ostrinia furnacalis]XP_028167366.1 fatty-acid amide hydrolase 2-like [Ostrinia furnacalis]XP_028167367.1 fatty-acid amide hydrolase 2-like [Ostrinia furnacalis]XP_028167368.1 fatty-acid amide hydrolase 2-like [Ostrinia furnacalis]XP_028167369.1 fatty-acid amide hydrolase 2-like [Ostrinia furnacalis]XP_028167370.1 fatty-acid amide hydrolase 2-like [Ostrinia furnacalis]XP_028167371.1 fatty-acid amide hydrolase 2-like [Ostrinia furnacalis]XP_028167372.1 fat
MCTSNVTKTDNPERRNRKSSRIFCGMASNILKHLYLIFRTYLDMFIDIVFAFIFEGKRQAIPDLESRHAILAQSAVSLAAKIRNKELTSQELVTACIERIKAVNPVLNAVVDERFEDALKEAKEIDKKIAEGLPKEYFEKKPFLGVPFTSKESQAVAGMLHPLGLKSRAHVRANEDAECVRLMRESGAIPVAVTTVPEVNQWQETRSMVHGQTNNPYHTGRTTGGSSGGEAALAAALATPIALCSDIGGSTRMPAFYCGLYGFKATPGYTSIKGTCLRSGLDPTMASIGFVSKHPVDQVPLTKIVAPTLDLDKHVDVKNVKYLYVETAQDLRVSPISKELRQAMTRVIKKLTEQAPNTECVPKEYSHAGLAYMFALWQHAMTKETLDFPAVLANNQGRPNAYVELVKKCLGLSQYTLAAVLKLFNDEVIPPINKEWAENLTKEFADDLTSALGPNGVLLFPSAPAAAPYHYALFTRPFNFAYWAIINALHMPAVQVPLGLNSEGLPIGIQVVAAPHNDALALAVAAHIGTTCGGYVPPCRIIE